MTSPTSGNGAAETATAAGAASVRAPHAPVMRSIPSATSATIIGDALPNIPWQDKPAREPAVVWRYRDNPIIRRDLFPTANSIFNSAVVPFRGKFAGVFR